jgi:small-conductance mechanosensitive channel
MCAAVGDGTGRQSDVTFFRSIESRDESMRNISHPVEVFTKIAFFVGGGIMIIDNLGISITPLVTTLGISSLAVAIALQDTLGNLLPGYLSRSTARCRLAIT